MRHVGRTHRVDLDWLFERIHKDPAISIKYVNTKQQLADILTKGSFTEATWKVLCELMQIQPKLTPIKSVRDPGGVDNSSSCIASQAKHSKGSRARAAVAIAVAMPPAKPKAKILADSTAPAPAAVNRNSAETAPAPPSGKAPPQSVAQEVPAAPLPIIEVVAEDLDDGMGSGYCEKHDNPADGDPAEAAPAPPLARQAGPLTYAETVQKSEVDKVIEESLQTESKRRSEATEDQPRLPAPQDATASIEAAQTKSQNLAASLKAATRSQKHQCSSV